MRRWTSAAIASPWSNASSGARRICELEQALHGNAEPVRSILQRAADFINRFFDQKAIEQRFEILSIFRHEGRVASSLQVCAQKGRADPSMPVACPWVQNGKILGAKAAEMAEQNDIGGVVKRSDHAGDIAER